MASVFTTARTTTSVDAVSVLSFFLFLLIALPSRLVLAPLGGAGSPAVIVGLGALAWWTFAQVRRPAPSGHGRQPIRWAVFAVVGALAASYVVAMTRAIDAEESSTAQLGPVVLLSWVGVLLLANDGISSFERFDVLVRRLVFAGGGLASLGVFQFFTGQTWVDRISIPGLSVTQSLGGFTSRGGYDRPPGTTLHAIEFGAVLTMILPIAINYALTHPEIFAPRRWFPVAAISLATVLSISRSAIICAVVAVVLLTFAWSSSVRRAAGVSFVCFATLIFLTMPGMLGTLTGMFTGIGNDSSAQSRVDSYAIAGEFIARSPWFGRGFGTFLPKYRILDNQYLGLIIEVGFVGLVAVLALIITAMVCSRLVRSVSPDPDRRQMGQAFLAATAAGGVGLAFYDGLGFPTAGGALFLLLGLAGAQWRLTRMAGLPQPESTP